MEFWKIVFDITLLCTAPSWYISVVVDYFNGILEKVCLWTSEIK